MDCPFCNSNETKVIDSRLAGEGRQVRRRRECLACTERFTTFETAVLAMPHVVKSDGRREPFDEEKLRRGLIKALEKRPVPAEAVEEAVAKINHTLQTTGEREVASDFVGELVMNALRGLDKVAYVRFASVYRQFEDVAAFREEVEKIERDARATRARSQLSLLPRDKSKS